MFQTISHHVTPAQLVTQIRELAAVIQSLEGVDKGEAPDDPRQLAFDELVSTACTLNREIYRRQRLCTDAEMAYALFWDHYECDAERLQDDVEDGVGVALMIARHVPLATATAA